VPNTCITGSISHTYHRGLRTEVTDNWSTSARQHLTDTLVVGHNKKVNRWKRAHRY
jgi:hypothetical protein